jgi:hypothetical protein
VKRSHESDMAVPGVRVWRGAGTPIGSSCFLWLPAGACWWRHLSRSPWTARPSGSGTHPVDIKGIGEGKGERRRVRKRRNAGKKEGENGRNDALEWHCKEV